MVTLFVLYLTSILVSYLMIVFSLIISKEKFTREGFSAFVQVCLCPLVNLTTAILVCSTSVINKLVDLQVKEQILVKFNEFVNFFQFNMLYNRFIDFNIEFITKNRKKK